MRVLILITAIALACSAPQERIERADARRRFADTVASMLLDTTLYELSAQLYAKIPNPNHDDESPLADRPVEHPASPGPHMMNGTVYAEIGALRALLGDGVAVRMDTTRDHVFVGTPPVLLVGHRHGGAMYVPVKAFARQYGAYTDIRCTLANCAYIWPRAVIDSMIRLGVTGGAGILGAHAEGLIRNLDVTRLPTG